MDMTSLSDSIGGQCYSADVTVQDVSRGVDFASLQCDTNQPYRAKVLYPHQQPSSFDDSAPRDLHQKIT